MNNFEHGLIIHSTLTLIGLMLEITTSNYVSKIWNESFRMTPYLHEFPKTATNCNLRMNATHLQNYKNTLDDQWNLSYSISVDLNIIEDRSTWFARRRLGCSSLFPCHYFAPSLPRNFSFTCVYYVDSGCSTPVCFNDTTRWGSGGSIGMTGNSSGSLIVIWGGGGGGGRGRGFCFLL